MKPAMPFLFLLVLATCPGSVLAENPCKTGAYLELTRMNPDSLTNRQFVNLLKYRESCAEYKRERSKQREKILPSDDVTDWFIGAVLGGFVFLVIAAIRF